MKRSVNLFAIVVFCLLCGSLKAGQVVYVKTTGGFQIELNSDNYKTLGDMTSDMPEHVDGPIVIALPIELKVTGNELELFRDWSKLFHLGEHDQLKRVMFKSLMEYKTRINLLVDNIMGLRNSLIKNDFLLVNLDTFHSNANKDELKEIKRFSRQFIIDYNKQVEGLIGQLEKELTVLRQEKNKLSYKFFHKLPLIISIANYLGNSDFVSYLMDVFYENNFFIKHFQRGLDERLNELNENLNTCICCNARILVKLDSIAKENFESNFEYLQAMIPKNILEIYIRKYLIKKKYTLPGTCSRKQNENLDFKIW